MTVAIHTVFNVPEDKIVFDVGHQSYVHKILTGRKDGFKSLRQFGGMSGFPKTSESDCDVFNQFQPHSVLQEDETLPVTITM